MIYYYQTPSSAIYPARRYQNEVPSLECANRLIAPKIFVPDLINLVPLYHAICSLTNSL
jgi:hypothetical protein